jgi:hypothetical protein
VYVKKKGRNFATAIADSTGKTAFEINTKVSPGKKERKKKKKGGRVTQRKIEYIQRK